MTNHQRKHYRFDGTLLNWTLTFLFLLLFIAGQLLDKNDAAADLQATADAKVEAIKASKQHDLDEQLAHDMRIAQIEYAREEQNHGR